MANTTEALGMIETRGLVGAIEAADAMVKAAKYMSAADSLPSWSEAMSVPSRQQQRQAAQQQTASAS